MLKGILSAVMVSGLLMTVFGFYQYSSSGTLLTSIDLSGSGVNQGVIEFTPSMSPMRAVLSTSFISRSTNMHVTHYHYALTIKDSSGNVILNEDQQHFESRKEGTKTHASRYTQRINHILDSWVVHESGTYQWQLSLSNKQARVQSAHLDIRQNVMVDYPKIVFLGAAMMVTSLLSLVIMNRGKSKTRIRIGR